MSATAYDQVPYPCNAYPQTHPGHLATLAFLHGMNPAPPEQCRVLEIGCGSGGGLLPLAYALPACRFLGIDLAETSIESARQKASEFGLKNIELRAVSLTDLRREDLGEWDYIIAHGVFSWVPEPVRIALLKVCKDMLAPQGVAFISYNAYPGGHIRNMVREMLSYHTANAPDAQSKIGQGRALLQFLAQGHTSEDDYGNLLRSEAERVLNFDPHHFFHDDLAEVNRPYYFHEFSDLAAAHGLQYLADADYSSMHDIGFPKDVRDVLAGLDDDIIRREQYVDFLKCRRFRQTLLCHADMKLDRTADPKLMHGLHFASSVTPAEKQADLRDDSTVQFKGEGTLELKTSHPLAKTALAYLGFRWPERVEYSDLERATALALGGAPDPGALEAVVLEFLKLGAAEPHLCPAPYTSELADKPLASAWARYQLQFGEGVTTLRHQTVHIGDEFGRWLLAQLDGQHTIDDIAWAMASTVKPGPDGELDINQEIAEARQLVADSLPALAKLGLLAR